MTQRLDLPPGVVADTEAMLRLGRYVAGQLGAGAVLALVGDLGTGKTTFVQGLAEGLSLPPDSVSSPTFGLVHYYRGGDLPLVHADLYRVASLQEAEAAGLADTLHDAEALVAVEWPLVVRDLLPRHTVWLQFQVVAAGRTVTQVSPPA